VRPTGTLGCVANWKATETSNFARGQSEGHRIAMAGLAVVSEQVRITSATVALCAGLWIPGMRATDRMTFMRRRRKIQSWGCTLWRRRASARHCMLNMWGSLWGFRGKVDDT